MRNTNESALVKQVHAGTERVTLKLMFFDEESVEKKFHSSSVDQWSDSKCPGVRRSLLMSRERCMPGTQVVCPYSMYSRLAMVELMVGCSTYPNCFYINKTKAKRIGETTDTSGEIP